MLTALDSQERRKTNVYLPEAAGKGKGGKEWELGC